MTDWQVVLLGVMALALVTMAAAQLVVAVSMMRAVRHISDAVDELRRDVRPVLEKANRIAEDASRISALAVVQAERADRLMRSAAARMDDTFELVQRAVIDPIRQGTAIVTALRAAFSAVRAWQNRPSVVSEDEDPLFVG